MPDHTEIASQLLSTTLPVAARMRAIFGLKGLNNRFAVSTLEKSLQSDPSVLVRHEVAYVLGQMRSKASLPALSFVLYDTDEDVMVRHEAAEAIGAIGDDKSILPLMVLARDPALPREIRETCELAVERIRWENGEGEGKEIMSGGFQSVDPVPAEEGERSVQELGDVLCDADKGIAERYRAMFALRNKGGKEAVQMLCKGMETETGSALFRHEVAYVLGQLQNQVAIPTLVKFLRDETESGMVRHEAAEALGAIGGVEVEKELDKFKVDKADVVRESVEVALDISEYVTGDDMHYADTIGVDGGGAVTNTL